MTQHDGGGTPPQTERPTTEVVRDEAAGIGRTAADRGSEITGTVGEQASRVASESTRQARNLLHEGKEQLSGQARQGQQRAADGLRTLADQLHQMSERSGGQGVAPEMARQVADRSRQVASWLENREPGDLVNEVRRYAHRKPGTFLLAATLAGVAVGRLTRGAVAAHRDDTDSPDSGSRSDSRGADWTSQRPAPPQTVPAPAGTRSAAPAAPPPVTPATPTPYPEQQVSPEAFPPASRPGDPTPSAPPVGSPHTGPVNR